MSTFYKATVCLLVLISVALPAYAKQAVEQEIYFYVDYHLMLSADGNIDKLTLNNKKLSAALTDNLEKQIRSWTYTAGSMDGKFQHTETTLSLKVKATPTDARNYQLTISEAYTGVRLQQFAMAQPKYPSNELRRGQEAALRFVVTYDTSGKVITAERSGENISGLAPFELASIKAIKQWRFEPEKIGGTGVAGSAVVPVRFCVAPSNCQSLYKGGKKEGSPAQELAEQMIPSASIVSIQRQPQLN
jgi:TonB family protein